MARIKTVMIEYGRVVNLGDDNSVRTGGRKLEAFGQVCVERVPY